MTCCFLYGPRRRVARLELRYLQTEHWVPRQHMDLGAHVVVVAAAARHMGILAAAVVVVVVVVVAVVAEQRYRAGQLNREPEHRAEEWAVAGSGGFAHFVLLRQEVSAEQDHPWM